MNQIQSENFTVDPETGVAGWQIKRDGTATFNNLVIGGSNYIIDQNGDAVFHSITLTADDTETAIFIHGEDIDPPLYNEKMRGVVKWTDISGSSPSTSTTSDTVMGRAIVTEFDTSRVYRVCIQLHLDDKSAATTSLGLRLRNDWVTDPETHRGRKK